MKIRNKESNASCYEMIESCDKKFLLPPPPCRCGELEYQIKALSEKLEYLQEQFDRHAYQGHIPKVLGVEKMKKVLDVLGLNEEYEVYKPMISVSSDKSKVDTKDK